MTNIRISFHYAFAVFIMLILLTTLTNPLQADSEQLKKNNDPSVPITLAVKGEALSDVMDLLEKQSGMNLRVSKAISDQKVTIFVDKQPLRDVMNALCSLFGYRWSLVKQEKGKSQIYELWEPESTRVKRQGRSAEEIDTAWNKLLTTKPGWLVLEAATQNNNSNTMAHTYVRFCQSLPIEDINAIRTGYSVHYSTITNENKWRLSDDIAKGLVAGIDPLIVNESDGISLTLKSTNPNRAGITLELDVLKVSPDGHLNKTNGYTNALLDEGIPLANVAGQLPFNMPEGTPLSATDPTIIDITRDDLIRESSVLISQSTASTIIVNRSDILALLHEKLGIQIISDHYSIFKRYTPIKGKLESFLKSISSFTASASTDGKFVYSRVMEIYTADSEEAPNRILRPLQETYASKKILNLPILVQIGSLEPTQIRALKDISEYLGLGQLGRTLNDRSIAAIHLYALLTPKQRQEALRNGVFVSSFTPNQRFVLLEMLAVTPIRLAPGAVGIYSKNKFRIDKNIATDLNGPVLVGMRVLPDVLVSVKAGTESSGQPNLIDITDGVSVQSIVESLRQSDPGINTNNITVLDRTGYEMLVILADETVERIPICFDFKTTPYNKFINK
ncbi:MAG: hypothetical protein ACYC27_22845 [Armatimonadota bacterium]